MEPFTDAFGVSYSGFNNSSAFACFRTVLAANGALSARSSFGFGPGVWNTDVAVNTASHNFVMTWWAPSGIYGAAFNSGEASLGTGLITSRINGNDNGTLDFNPISQTFLFVGSDIVGFEAAGVELNATGAPITSVTTVTSGASTTGNGGSFHPRNAARSDAAQWNVVYSRNLATISNQIIGTSSTNGGAAGSLGAATPPSGGGSTPAPSGCTTADPFAGLGGGTCVNGGWLPPSGGSSGGSNGGSTSGCPTDRPGVDWTCVNGGWLPPSSGGSTGGIHVRLFNSAAGRGVDLREWRLVAAFERRQWRDRRLRWLRHGRSVREYWRRHVRQRRMGAWRIGRRRIEQQLGLSTVQPGAGWTCVNGGWLPPSSGGNGATGGSGGCATADPFASIGGGTCVNGGWVPGGSGARIEQQLRVLDGPAGCGLDLRQWRLAAALERRATTRPAAQAAARRADPFATIGGGTCVNGGWVPGGSGVGSVSSCTTIQPGSGWTCVNGGWVPPGSSLAPAPSGGCSTADSFGSIGGGV